LGKEKKIEGTCAEGTKVAASKRRQRTEEKTKSAKEMRDA